MQTIFLDQPYHLRLGESELPPPPGQDEALVRIHRVGICGTDLHAFEGTQPFFSYPRILGHELGVEVLAIGPTSKPTALKVGDYAAVEPYLNCGTCSACRRGKTNCCERLRVFGVHIDGGMRQQLLVPIHKLHRTDTLSLEQLALIEPLCIGAHAVHRAAPEPDEPVLVIGAGPIGIATLQAARVLGANVSVMEVNERRIRFVQEELGIEQCIDARQDALAQVRAIYNGELPTIVFDATGSPKSMMQAIQYVSNGSKLVFVGLVQGQVSIEDAEWHRREVTLLRSRNATSHDFAWVLHQIESGALDVSPWITHRVGPEQLVTDFATWLKPETGVVKAMLEL